VPPTVTDPSQAAASVRAAESSREAVRAAESSREAVRAAESSREAASRVVAESLRRNARYVEEVVIGWNLCPWAARAWRAGEVARRVLVDETLEAAATLAFIDELCATPTLSIGLAIFPRATVTDAAFASFAERVRRADRARRAPDEEAPFLLAAFHPHSCPAADFENSAQLVAFVRRTPDPTLQLVRASLVDALSRGGRDVSGDIARDNFATVIARDPAALGALLADIRRDRDSDGG
jgi:hypothetical protein